MKLSDYLAWIRQYDWTLKKGHKDWNLLDEKGNFKCSIIVSHPGPKEVVAISVKKTERKLRERGFC